MSVRLVREFRFEAAHRLNNVPDGHRCGMLHGHSYRLEITLEGPIDPQSGWLIDFGEIDKAWRPLHDQLDHSLLNDLPGLENTTCELLTQWLWNALKPALPMLKRIALWETQDARCEYDGPTAS